MNNGAYPAKWNSHPPPLVPSVINSMEPQLPIQPGMLKNHRDPLHPHNKQKPPDYYQYPAFPRQAYPSPMHYPHTPYDMSGYPMAPMGMQRRPPAEWTAQWGQDMTPIIDTISPAIPQPEATWANDWGHNMYAGQVYGSPYRGYHLPPREQLDPHQLKQSLSPVPSGMGGHTMNSSSLQGPLSPLRTHQVPRSNMSQTNSEFPAYSPNPQSTSHLSPLPVPHAISRTPTSSLSDLNREVSKDSCHSTPNTPFRHPSMELNNSREDTPTLSRQQTPPTSHLALNPPQHLSAPKRGPGRKKLDSSLPFDQWIQEHGLSRQLQESGRDGHDFYIKLLQYLYEAQGGAYASPSRSPLVGKDEVNLFQLHKLVEANGGVKQLCEKKEWKKVFQMFNYQSKGSTGVKALKQVYSKWLLPFICHIKGDPIEPVMELCRSSSRPRKQQSCQSDTLSVTSPTPLSEESQEVPESPASFQSSMSACCSPSKLSRDKVAPCVAIEDKDRPTSSDTKPFLPDPEDPPHPQPQPFIKPSFPDPLSSLDQSSPPFYPNKAKYPPAMHPMEVLKPKIKQEPLLDGTDTHHAPYPYFSHMYPHMGPDPYHLMGPRHPYPRLMPPLMQQQPRWPSPLKDEWVYVQPRPPQAPDTSRMQSATPESKPRVPREKPALPPTEAGDKPPVSHKRVAEVARPGHVELTTPVMRKRKKQPPDMTMTDPFRLTMALRSGVLSDTAWALDYLTILLNHNGTRDLYHLRLAHGLLDALVACWLRCLLDMFPGELTTPDHPGKLEPEPELIEDTEDLPPPLQIATHEPPACDEDTLPHTLCHLKTPFSAKATQPEPPRMETPSEPPGAEEEVLRPMENVLFLHATHETQLGSMAICISNLIRCLSFIPGNELILSAHESLLALIGQLLLLRHTHPHALSLPTRTHDTSDTFETQEDTFEDTEYVLESNRCEWWWRYLDYVREDIFVVLCNMAGALDFSQYPSSVARHLLSGLLHWLICPSTICQDPLPLLSNTTWLSPKRLVLECLSKLSVLPANVDYLLATPTHELAELIRELSRWSINRKDVIARQFVFMLLYNLCGTQDMCPHYLIARQTPILQVLMECVELPPPSQPPQTQRATKTATFQEELSVLCALRRRAAGTLYRLSLHPENHSLFLELQPRLLALVCPPSDTTDTFKGDAHLRQLVLETISHLCKD